MRRKTFLPTPEEVLLLAVASRAASTIEPPDDDQRRQCEQLMNDRFDWGKFLYLAHRQRCVAAAHCYFSDLGLKDDLPPQVLEVLKDQRDLAQATYIGKLAELESVVGTFRRNGIDPLVLKGIPLAHRLYTDPTVRVSRDIDLLCKVEDLDRAEGLLEAAGYSRLKGRISHEEYRTCHYHSVYVRGEHMDSAVEIHWNLRAPIKGVLLNMDPLRERATSIEIDGTEIRTLDETDALWHLGVNSSFEGFLDLRDLADLRRLARKTPASEWVRLAAFSRKNGTYNELSTALAVSERAFGEFLPPDARRVLRPNLFIRAMLVPTFSARGIAWRWVSFKDTHQLVVYFFLREGVPRKLNYLWRIVFPTRSSLIESRGSIERPRHPMELFRFHATGGWILLKVLGLITLSAFLAKTGLPGSRRLDPERNVRWKILPTLESSANPRA